MKVEMPEHEKLAKIQRESQVCGEFMDWLFSEKGIVLAKYDDETRRLWPSGAVVVDLLAEFFGIDQAKIEDEKRALLAAIRRETSDGA
jgi:hypothetical protein